MTWIPKSYEWISQHPMIPAIYNEYYYDNIFRLDRVKYAECKLFFLHRLGG